MDAHLRDQLTASFRDYLDAADDARHSAPDAKATPDLFTLLAEVSALKNEVKLESRQVKTALDEFRGLFELLRDKQAQLDEEQAQRRSAERTREQQAQKDLLLELLEVRDRLEAGQLQARRFKPGLLGRRKAKPFVASMAEGMVMNLRRLDESLTRRGVSHLPVVGRPFDPHTMHATGVVADPEIPVGQVVEELRKGFLHGDTLLRPAEVVVNRAPAKSRHEKPRLNT
ncbi:nucleotide exchange factor GrpE [Thiorhodococcus minor]|uniref:Protein GrpE n=1 Tax=Thiorhodococcus minor TaxID=57489 RepID=A0A6M0K3H2_9GAMM|nr:nucleotide exchange factor GrpE [Thiorhodococcus minor]NEV63959.1 nucleotide exchange factor GrpE [Thiorhodococcus minor]